MREIEQMGMEELVRLTNSESYYIGPSTGEKLSYEEQAKYEILRRHRLLMDVVEKAPKWIPVEKDLPEYNKMVLIATLISQRGPTDYAFRDFKTGEFMVHTMAGWDAVTRYGGTVTHWMYPPRLTDEINQALAQITWTEPTETGQ